MIKDLGAGAKLAVVLAYLFLIGWVTVMGSGGEKMLDLDDPSMMIFYKVVQVISVILIFILPAIMFSIFFTKEKLGYLALNKFPKALSFLLVLVLMVSAAPIINWSEQLNQHMRLPAFMSGIEEWMQSSEASLKKVTEAFMVDKTAGGLILNLFVIAFMAALSEELFFRGVLQKALIGFTKNVHAGIWIGAFLFSAFHMQFYGFLPRLLMGAVLGYLFVWSGSIWLSTWAHFVNNGAAVLLAWLQQRGALGEDSDNIGTTGNNDSLFVIASVVMVTGLLVAVHRVEKNKDPDLTSLS